MEKSKTAEAYYSSEHHYKDAIGHLRELAKTTEAVETCKWGMPVYTVNNKNVFGICRFKDFFGVWFFQGVFLKDPKDVLRNAQEGKTKAMRHWNFSSIEEIDDLEVVAYMKEAIENQKQGKEVKPEKKSTTFVVPNILKEVLDGDSNLETAFRKFSPYKQKEFSEYINEAKQEKTKLRRLEKILPLIKKGVGLNDAYR